MQNLTTRSSGGSVRTFNHSAILLILVWSLTSGFRTFAAQDAPGTGVAPDITESDPAEAQKRETLLLQRTRQLTFEGRRAGESYFSADGRKMIFQSEREPGNPFFQIYLMDLENGDVERVSPGLGKTTCAWIHPHGDRILFASTHEDPDAEVKQREELELRASGKERRYAWDYDEHYEIYEYIPETQEYRRLTSARGYDAEASWSPDGSLIAFASNRSAWEEALTDEQQRAFDLDPAWANEIYIMKSDGSELKRLTHSPGYDGGPFFSADGRKICWRRFSENGAIAEIMTMNVDGSDQKQLTHMQSMSWAPYFHPSGQYLIFTTNRHGFANFELYLIDADGKGEPVRVTHTPGFDGLPVFTPDGNRLAWTTNRTTNSQSQIFMADWDHQKALQLLGLSETSTNDPAASSGVTASRVMARSVPERRDFAPADAVRHVEYLCRPQLAGRMTGTRGELLATNYVALHFETLGLIPAGDDGSYFQEFEFTAGVSAGPGNRLVVGEQELTLHTDWRPAGFSGSVSVDPAEVVFAGYGIRIDASDGQEEYDSYVHLDVKDKWVVVFRYMPENLTPEQRQRFSSASRLRFKAIQARDLGARGMIVVSGPTSGVREQLIPMTFDGASSATFPVVGVSDRVAGEWFSSENRDLKSIQEKLDTGEPAMGLPLKGLTISAVLDIRQEKKKGRNVLGRLQINENPAHQIVVVGAHIDHLGAGPNGNSLARGDEQSAIHFGADDNASGVSAMMQIAEAMAGARDSGELKGTRDVVFAAWSGEEIGLLGSTHYVRTLEEAFSQHAAAFGSESPPESAENRENSEDEVNNDEDTGPNTGGLNLFIAACLNMDMVGRLQERLILQGTGSSAAWQRIVEQANVPLGLNLSLQEDTNIPTDASVFYRHGVPILSAFTGNHGEYHTPRDTPEKLNYEGISSVARLMMLVCRQIISDERPPLYLVQEAPRDTQRKASLRAYLGTVPDYADSDVKGVLLSGVAKDGPADQAGVKGGDVIVRLAGRTIENIYDYTYAIEALKAGQEVEIAVSRQGREIVMKVTPGSRD